MYDGRECFLCGRNGCGDPLDKHHIFGGAYRKKADRYGLYVFLCHDRCHENGKNAAHRSRETMDMLHRYGQKKAMEEQGWSREEFVLEFGRNYLDEDELAELTEEMPEVCRRAEGFAVCTGPALPW